jgi:transposase-like protein
MRKCKASAERIAAAVNLPVQTVTEAIAFEENGQRPVRKPPGKRRPSESIQPPFKYVLHRNEIVRLKDQEGRSFASVARVLGISSKTARLAYHGHHAQMMKDAKQDWTQPRRAPYSKLGREKKNEIAAMLRQESKVKAIATQVGCSESTVYRMKSSCSERGTRC